jgi:DNA-binding response OmpR family regulator
VKRLVLSGRSILVVEDEPVLALDIEAALIDAGAEVVGPAITVDAARELAGRDGLSAAVLDVRLGPDHVYSVADLLHIRGIPFIFHTAHADEELNKKWPAALLVQKPSSTSVIVRALASLFERSSK